MSNQLATDREVAVIGAAGYVGQRLCVHLQKRGYQVTGVCRPYAAFLMERLGVATMSPSEAGGGRRFSRVINLAYPTRGAGYSRREQNAEIVNLVAGLLKPGGQLVHTSTLAVFGFGLEVPPVAGPVAMRMDFEYCVSKIAMEHALTQRFGTTDLHLVRLGNVWGAACPNWAAGLLDRLRTGLPVAVKGRTGWSNSTEVGNVCDYLEFLLRQPAVGQVRYHHLAEFAATPWAEFIQFLAGELKVNPVTVPAIPELPKGRLAELRAALRSLDLNGVLRGVTDARQLGGDVRAVLSRLPASVLKGLKRIKGTKKLALTPPLTAGDIDFLTVVSCQRQFPAATLPGWTPPVSVTESLSQVRAWMQETGYV